MSGSSLLSAILISCLAAVVVGTPAVAQDTPTPTDREDRGSMVRMLCVQSLTAGEEELMLASKTEEGQWRTHGEITLRSPFITSWVEVPRKPIHLVREQSGGFSPVGSFEIGPDTRRAVVILLPNPEGTRYQTRVIDPGKLRFDRGKALIVNYSPLHTVVRLGETEELVAPGRTAVVGIDAEDNGMYRMLMGYRDRDGDPVAFYDRYVSSNPRTRKFILIFPDPNTRLRAMSLSEFGPFE